MRSTSAFGPVQKNVNLLRRVAYFFAYTHVGASKFEARFHWKRFGGEKRAMKAATSFIAKVSPLIAPIVDAIRERGPALALRGSSSLGLPAGVSVRYAPDGDTVVAQARRKVLGEYSSATMGVEPAQLSGCVTRMEVQVDEAQQEIEAGQQVLDTLRALAPQFGAVVSISHVKGTRLRAGVAAVPRLYLAPEGVDAEGRHAYAVRFGKLFSATFAWHPTEAQSAYSAAKDFFGQAHRFMKQRREFSQAFRRFAGSATTEFGRGIRKSGNSLQVSRERVPGERFQTRLNIRDFATIEDAVNHAKVLRADDRATLQRARAGVCLRVLNTLARKAQRLDAKPAVASRTEVLAAIKAVV